MRVIFALLGTLLITFGNTEGAEAQSRRPNPVNEMRRFFDSHVGVYEGECTLWGGKCKVQAQWHKEFSDDRWSVTIHMRGQDRAQDVKLELPYHIVGDDLFGSHSSSRPLDVLTVSQDSLQYSFLEPASPRSKETRVEASFIGVAEHMQVVYNESSGEAAPKAVAIRMTRVRRGLPSRR